MSKEKSSLISYSRKLHSNGIEYSAAVIIPIIRRENEINIVFTKRSNLLSRHAGEIAFPGGRIEKGETPAEAAERELGEEISGHVLEFVAVLDPVYTFVSSHFVLPYVALLKDEVLSKNEEVEKILYLDLEILRNFTPKYEILEYGSLKLRSYAWSFDDFYVWGVTGRILFSFKKKFGDSQFKNIVYNKMG